MDRPAALRLATLLLCLASAAPLWAAPGEVFTLANGRGAELEFTDGEGGWRWTRLKSPGGRAEGWVVEEGVADVATAVGEGTVQGWEQIEASPERLVLERDATGVPLRLRRIFTFGPAANVVRIETWVRGLEGGALLTRIALLEARIEGAAFRETGAAPASFPLFGDGLFAGIEHVSGEASVAGEQADQVRLMQRPRLALDESWQPVAATIVGWPVPGMGPGLTNPERLREAFLLYLDSVRIKPERMILHTDTWWTVPLPLSEKNVLNDIENLRRVFLERTGLFFDTYCVDLGWSDPRTFWQMEAQRFPDGLRGVQERLGGLGTRLGLWMSPGSGYPEGLNNDWLRSQGYELTPFGGSLGQVPCFALGGKYQRDFKERAVAYARQYELGHLILDFMAQRCDVAAHGHPVGPESRYAIDAGLADVLDGVRAVNPQMALEPMVCGYPPSPWWLMKTPFVLGPAGDDLPYGRGPSPDWLESLITARDIAYRAGQEAWIMPTQALETFDIIVLSPGEFENMAVMAIGRGRWFISTYFDANLMKPGDWDFLAALVRWARQNKASLVNAWQFGGRPEAREAYGFMFRNPGRDLHCVRNPWIEGQTIELPASAGATEAREVRMIYPRRVTLGRLEPGERSLAVALAPYETAFIETVPAGETTPPAWSPPRAEAIVTAAPPRQLAGRVGSTGEEPSRIRYFWDGNLQVPEVMNAELCVLVEGAMEVRNSTCKVVLGGREVVARKVTSAGQFGAAIDASPENWTWFLVPLAPGETTFQIDLSASLGEAAVSVFLRGALPAPNDPAPEGTAVFPTHQAERRAWSQVLHPRQILVADSP